MIKMKHSDNDNKKKKYVLTNNKWTMIKTECWTKEKYQRKDGIIVSLKMILDLNPM